MIWLLWGHNLVSKRENESKWFLLFSLSDNFFLLFMCALFSVGFMQIYYRPQALMSLRSVALGNHTLKLSRTLLHDISAYARHRRILGRWKFHQISLKVYHFCHRKVSRQPHFLFPFLALSNASHLPSTMNLLSSTWCFTTALFPCTFGCFAPKPPSSLHFAQCIFAFSFPSAFQMLHNH